MGGNALKYIKTVRKNNNEYVKISNEITRKLDVLSINYHVLRSYINKDSHGDLDIIILSKNLNPLTMIIDLFNPDEYYKNGNVISFNYGDFQIDFNFVDNIEIASIYMDFDPLGNLMGKSFHKFNLSYGWNGLYYKFRNFNGKNSENILISTDPKKIFKFGGYDYDRYQLGFETIEDIFKFVINSEYFDSKSLQLNNLNQIDRKRNRKRSSYNAFLKYLDENNIDVSYQFSQNKSDYIPMINNFFPEANLLEKLNILAEKDREDKIIATKFNGDIVMSLIPNLMGKELGAAITKFKNHLGDDYREFILKSNFNTIMNEFLEVYNG